MPKNTHRKEIEMKKVLTVLLVSIPSLLLCALIVFGVFLMKVPVTQKSIDLLEKGMTFAEVFEVLKSDIIITPVSAEGMEKIEYGMNPEEVVALIGDDYETDSWRNYSIYEYQTDDDTFLVWFGDLDSYNKNKVIYFATHTEWQHEMRAGREFDENDESIKVAYVYVTATSESGFVASLDNNEYIFFEYYNADKFFNEFTSLAVYYDEDTMEMREGTLGKRGDSVTYNGKARAVSARFTDPEKGEPQFG